MKVDFQKVENILSDTLQKIFIDHLSELAAIANLINEPETTLTKKMIDEIVSRFQTELKRLQEKDKKLYQKLELSAEDEQRFNLPAQQFTQDDWQRLKLFKERIDDLKRELLGEKAHNAQDEKRIEQERRRHVYKRFNIREGWLPLH
ncbi:hypothetical protein [Candidatus Protochlamydia phocaeensis]|uniref:hypothetical protein n=1 Tax=Candidatus Protochlamydia phocaeensis TaxID=1414722 RepID=UPI000837C33A|nr:hypothetical protein [Candidatus Protochlamydia phocaeensis]